MPPALRTDILRATSRRNRALRCSAGRVVSMRRVSRASSPEVQDVEPQTLSRNRFGVATARRPGRQRCWRDVDASRSGRRQFRPGLLPRAGRASLHQRVGHLHCHDRLAHAARSHGRDQLRVQAIRHARGAPDQSRRADREAGTGRRRTGYVRRRVSTDARDGGRPHGRRSAEDGRAPGPCERKHEERGHHPEIPSLWLRSCRSQLRRAPGRGRDAGRSGAGGQSEDRHDALLQQQQQRGPDSGRGVRPARKEACDSHVQRCRRRCAAGREPVEVHEDGFRPGDVLRRQGDPGPAERRAAAREQGRSSPRPASTLPRTATPSAAG